MAKTKYTREIWIRLVDHSSSEVSGPSEVSQFVGKLIFLISYGSQADLRALDNIVLTYTSDILVRLYQFIIKYRKPRIVN